MKPIAGAVAQKLLNLYRQEHVIVGGWTTVNKIFVDEADEDVIAALRELPTGPMLVRHIENLRSGKTPMDTIERELMPYGGLMSDATDSLPLTAEDWRDLESLMETFTPDTNGLDELRNARVIRKFGEEWIETIGAAMQTRPELRPRWDIVTKTYQAYRLWDTATAILNQPLSERARAELQADMPDYETYLPMFGADGEELLAKLRNFISNAKPD